MTNKPLTQNDVVKLAVTAYAVTHPKETANFIKNVFVLIVAAAFVLYFIAVEALNRLQPVDMKEIAVALIAFAIVFVPVLLFVAYPRQILKFIAFLIKMFFVGIWKACLYVFKRFTI